MFSDRDRFSARANLCAESARRIGECGGERARSTNGDDRLSRCPAVCAVTRDAVEEHRCGGAWAHWANGVVDCAAPGEECEQVLVVLDVLAHEI